ncbi:MULTISPECIES: AMP-binding protein [unclassified Candidatus Frackibacter]|uniref:AMP-binding protein n=1 Tax=unclassified Candidatus Frackibacter TaxID=2648818 RepID=UPI000891A1EE|nr:MULTISPECIES: AMP-binding protein [unclassified Candidatus Frackibacter]SDC17499.1 fatty-acyl-CoA synthase [Candidatus Frackibacter sp. WG11]SEM44391.1 fatty-acyl-CoA synthase [Candidatus Frackibacter sp. WG12]SFL46947.1 fatty-acyl-CoA synthase [Candidatus Frackibacter sp. WG13]
MTKELEMTIGELLDQQAVEYAENDAVVYVEEGIRYSYREFRDVCNQAAKGFMKLGIEVGDHIAVWAHNRPEWLTTQFATGKMGGILVTVNTNYRTSELEYLLKNSDTETLILSEGMRTSYPEILYKICPELKECEPGELESEKLPRLKNIIYIGEGEAPAGMYHWDDIMEMGKEVSDVQLEERQDSLDPDDVINMQYTSGTTGFPKGVMLTHANIIADATYIGECMDFSHEDRLCIPVPFFHCFGCVLGTLTCVTAGATMVPVVKFKPEPVLKAIEAERCTAVHGVPTMFIAKLEDPNFDKYDLSSLRTGIMAGSPCPMSVMRQVIDKMGADEITIAYGQTESSPVITQTRVDDSIERKVSTVGKALPNVEVKIVDPETGEEVGPGIQGELCTRGFHVMKGYYKMPEATEEAIDEDGWLHTGDLAVMDRDGYFKITGRLKDMIIRGGENVYPREVEEFMYEHPEIKDVQVVGIPDEKYGEEVMAYIQLKEGTEATSEEIFDYFKDKLSWYKIPKKIEIVDEYPMTASGKVQKYKLREMAM